MKTSIKKTKGKVRLVILNDSEMVIFKSELVSYHYSGGASCERIYAGLTQNSSDPDPLKCKKLLNTYLKERQNACGQCTALHVIISDKPAENGN